MVDKDIFDIVKENVKKCRKEYPDLSPDQLKRMARKDGVNDCTVQAFKNTYYGCAGDYNKDSVDKNVTDDFYIQANNFDEFKAMIGSMDGYNTMSPEILNANADKYLDIIIIHDCRVSDALVFSVGRLFADLFIVIETSGIENEKTRYLIGNKFCDLTGIEIKKIITENVKEYAKESYCIDVEEKPGCCSNLRFRVSWD